MVGSDNKKFKLSVLYNMQNNQRVTGNEHFNVFGTSLKQDVGTRHGGTVQNWVFWIRRKRKFSVFTVKQPTVEALFISWSCQKLGFKNTLQTLHSLSEFHVVTGVVIWKLLKMYILFHTENYSL